MINRNRVINKVKQTMSQLLKSLPVFLFILLLGCKSDDNGGQALCELTPPSWLIGDWNEVNGTETWTFTSSSIIRNARNVCDGLDECWAMTEIKESNAEYQYASHVGPVTCFGPTIDPTHHLFNYISESQMSYHFQAVPSFRIVYERR